MQESLFFLVEQLLFFMLLFLGLSFVIQNQLWIKLIKFLYSQEEQTFQIICLVSGAVLTLPVGLLLVLTHNDWELSPSLIVTVIGWVALVKALFLILYPKIFLKFKALYGKSESFLKWYLRICGILYILMGLIGILFAGFYTLSRLGNSF